MISQHLIRKEYYLNFNTPEIWVSLSFEEKLNVWKVTRGAAARSAGTVALDNNKVAKDGGVVVEDIGTMAEDIKILEMVQS